VLFQYILVRAFNQYFAKMNTDSSLIGQKS